MCTNLFIKNHSIENIHIVTRRNETVCLKQNSCTTKGVNASTKLLPNSSFKGAKDFRTFLSNFLSILHLYLESQFLLRLLIFAATEKIITVKISARMYDQKNKTALKLFSCSEWNSLVEI